MRGVLKHIVGQEISLLGVYQSRPGSSKAVRVVCWQVEARLVVVEVALHLGRRGKNLEACRDSL